MGDLASRERAIEEEFTRSYQKNRDAVAVRVPEFQDRMLKLASEKIDHAASRDALIWVVAHGQFSAEAPLAMKRAAQAADLLVQHHIEHSELSWACIWIHYITDPPEKSVDLLRAIRMKSPHDVVRAEATFALAEVLSTRGNATLDRSSREGLYKEAEGYLEEVRNKYSDLRLRERADRYGERADRLLYEIRNLSAGRRAPQLEGGTLDGKTLRLSDYRGRVVLLVFNKTGCPGCVALYPFERAISKRLIDRPFAIIGVHAGEEKHLASTRTSLAEHRAEWPVVWSAGMPGKSVIESRWNIHSYPTLYLIDADGVIRLKSYGSPGEKILETAVDALVKEAEARPKTP
jgi:peroxiredoxin